MNAFVHHFSFEFRTGIRNRQLLMLNYLFPLGFYLLMGFIMTGINPMFRETIIPSMVVFAALSATLLGIPDPLVNARENGIFRSYKINGVPSFSILLIPALTTILHLVIVSIIIIISAPLMFDAPVPENYFYFALVLLALALASAGISVVIGVVSPSSRMTVLWSQLLFVPSMLLGGLMLPLSFLPQAAASISLLLPATHAMNAFNGLAMGGETVFSPWISVVVLVTGGLLAFGLAIFLFSWDSRNTTRRGHPALGFLAIIPYVISVLLFL
jgi:ABC-2 type transport system permease protein